MKNMIVMKNIHKFYKNGKESLEALKGISFALKQGEILAIMGSSGSGKSTLLHIMGAMDQADEGEIYIGGQEITHLSGSFSLNSQAPPPRSLRV